MLVCWWILEDLLEDRSAYVALTVFIESRDYLILPHVALSAAH